MFSPESYQALRTAAVFTHRSDRAAIRALGADAPAWLQGLLTNDLEALTVCAPQAIGEARYAAYLTAQGRMITDARVVRLAHAVLMDVPESLAAALVTRLDALIFAEDVQIEDDSSAILVVELHGPHAPRLAGSLRDALSEAVAIVRDDQYGVPGFAIYVKAGDRDALDTQLRAAGAVGIDLETLDVIRIEAGRPAFLTDMDTDTIPLEAGIEDRAISFTKGCYVGQEIIVRVTQRGGGRVARRLVGLTVSGGRIPKADDRLMSGDRDIGWVTSAVLSPTVGQPIALGYLHRDFVEPGTAVTVFTDDGLLDAVVTKTPFVM